MVYDRFKGMALILYSEIEFAQAAVKETKGRKIGGTIVKVCADHLNKTVS